MSAQRFLRSACLTLVILTLFLTVATASAADKTPSLSITSPKAGKTVTAVEVEIKLSAKNAPTRARYRYALDGATVTTTTKTSIKVTGLSEGNHTAGTEMLSASGQSLTPQVTAQVTFDFKAPAKPGKPSKDAIQAPARPSAEIAEVGCGGQPLDEPDSVTLRLAARGTVQLSLGQRLLVYHDYPGGGGFFSPNDTQLQGTDRSGMFMWIATESREYDERATEFPVTIRVVLFDSNGPAGGTELARKEFTCKIPPQQGPKVTVDLVDCVVIDRQGERRAYQITAAGTAFGPENAEVILSLGTDADGLFTLGDVQTKWHRVGSNGMRRDAADRTLGKEADPAFTNWSVTVRTTLLPAVAARNAIGTAALVAREQQIGGGARTTRPCETQSAPTATPLPTSTPRLETTISPARDLTGTWRGGINMIEFSDDPLCQWSGSITLNLAQNGNDIVGNALVALDTITPLKPTARCGLAPFQLNNV